MATIKAILFDLDGTLIDSEYFHFECWNDILSASGIQLTYEDWLQSYAGIPLETNAQNIHQKYKLQAPLEEIISNRKALTLRRLNNIEVPLMHYVKEILDFFTAKNLTLALVTGSSETRRRCYFRKEWAS
jgi:beta-phosphoglucomutase